MITELETRISEALACRGDAITPATLRHAGPSAVRDGSVTPIGPRRHSAIWLSVAAVAVLVTTVTALTSGHGGSALFGAAGAPPHTTGQQDGESLDLLRTLHFAIDLPAGDEITKVSTSADGRQYVEIATADGKIISLSVDPPEGPPEHFAADVQPIIVAGHPGFLGSTWTDPASRSLDTTISWRYNDVAYASFVDPQVDRRELLDLASRIDFSKRTPVRVPTAIHALPAGVSVADVDMTYRDITDDGNPEPPLSPWNSTIALAINSSLSNSIRIDLCRCASAADQRHHGGDTHEVNGKTAYVYDHGSGGYAIEIDQGDGVALIVSSSHDEDAGARWTGSLQDLLDLAGSVTITPHPNQPSTWFTAATAIP